MAARERGDDTGAPGASAHAGLRVDKWLWAARFFKTRALATLAVDAGHVKLDGARIKPSRALRAGDRLTLRVGEQDWEITVVALSDRRGPATEARRLYVEDPASMARREAHVRAMRAAHDPSSAIKGRPTKRDRRLIHRFTDGA